MIIKVSPPPQVSTGGRHGALLFCRRSAELLRCITDRSLRAVMADITEAESPIAGSAKCKRPHHLCLHLGRNTEYVKSEREEEAQLSKRRMRQKPVCRVASGKKLSRDKKLRLPGCVAEVEMFRIAGAAGSHCFLPADYFVVSKLQ